VLEEKRFRRMGEVRDRVTDVQLIAATHQDLHGLIREKKFRSDLYFRISTIPLTIPPLRERSEDIPMLAQFFLSQFGSEMSSPNIEIAPGAMKSLVEYSWPGNVRELKNVIERAILLSDRHGVTARDLRFDAEESGAPAGLPPPNLTLEELERWYVERVLREENGHVEAASKRLGVPRSSLYQKIRRWDIAVSKS
jgi:DNA-binding NtrC family response regulator